MPPILKQVSPQRHLLGFYSNRIFVGPRSPWGRGSRKGSFPFLLWKQLGQWAFRPYVARESQAGICAEGQWAWDTQSLTLAGWGGERHWGPFPPQIAILTRWYWSADVLDTMDSANHTTWQPEPLKYYLAWLSRHAHLETTPSWETIRKY